MQYVSYKFKNSLNQCKSNHLKQIRVNFTAWSLMLSKNTFIDRENLD